MVKKIVMEILVPEDEVVGFEADVNEALIKCGRGTVNTTVSEPTFEELAQAQYYWRESAEGELSQEELDQKLAEEEEYLFAQLHDIRNGECETGRTCCRVIVGRLLTDHETRGMLCQVGYNHGTLKMVEQTRKIIAEQWDSDVSLEDWVATVRGYRERCDAWVEREIK